MTAEEIRRNYSLEYYDEGGYQGLNEEDIIDMMIDFAKYHVQEALESASKNATMCTNYNAECYKESEESGLEYVDVHDVERGGEFGSVHIEKESILNSYPLANIK